MKITRLILALLLTSTAYATDLVLQDFTIIDGISNAPHPHMTVVVKAEKITAVVPAASFHPDSKNTVIEGKGKFLIPGLWDAHVHLSYGDEAMLGVLVANGVTSVRDMGGDLPLLDFWRTLIADGKIVGPQIYRAGPLVDGPKPGIAYHLTVTNADEAVTVVQLLKKMGVDFIKVHTAVPRDAYFAIAKETARLHIPFAGHIPMAIEPAEAVDAGQHSVEHIATIFEGKYLSRFKNEIEAFQAFPAWLKEEGNLLAQKFAKHGTWFDPTLIAYDVRARVGELINKPDPNSKYVSPGLRRFWDEAFPIKDRDKDPKIAEARKDFVEKGLELTRLMQEAGVGIVAGTDLGGRNVLPGFAVRDEIALLARALPKMTALQAATSKPAAMLYVADRVGSIARGNQADLVILRADPLENWSNLSSIDTVVLRGKVLTREQLDQLLDRAASENK